MQRTSKLLAIFLASMLLLGLAACNGGGKGETTTTEPKSLGQGGESLTLVAVFNAGEGSEGRREYPYYYDGGLTVQVIADGLSELTGLPYGALAVTPQGEDLYVDLPADCAVFGGVETQDREEFPFRDYDSMAWFMLDSLSETMRTNIPGLGVHEIFFTMGGGKALVLENLSPGMDFTLETPYMGSAFYQNHFGGRGDEDIDPSDVAWWGEYGCEAGMLNIGNYNDRGMGWSFHFVFDNGETTDDGTAAVFEDDPRQAEYGEYTFFFNMNEDTELETITVTGGEFAGEYGRAENAVG